MKKYGLDYLINKGERRAATPQAQADQPEGVEHIDRAVATLGRRVLMELKGRQSQGNPVTRLHDLVEALDVDRDTLGLVVGRMASLGLVDVESEKFGNHFVRLTRLGDDSLNISSP